MIGYLNPIIMSIPATGFRSSKFKHIALGLFASAILAASHASAAPEHGEAQRELQLHRICEAAMGVTPGTAEYAACVDSLQQTLTDADEVASIQEDRATCNQKGLKPRTVDFALCLVDHENTTGIGH